ncbi:MAG TPA: di-heme oxidoredictase family protein [Vicinamibacterales bacterium]|nr:di-heme oxidoredictase family protein [Vicinamibacterales bacterium]
MKVTFALAAAASLLIATAIGVSGQSPIVTGDPLPGITPTEFQEFRIGLEDFREIEEASDGLGPLFNGTGCAVCHNVPAIGGSSPMTELRGGFRDSSGRFHIVGGTTLFQMFSLPDHRCQAIIPPEANVVARRAPIPLFGAGLVEAIPDETLLALEDPFDRDRDGISGRAAVVVDKATGQRRVGRFGWKAQIATLLTFSGDAYTNEMGITNDVFPEEPRGGVSEERLRECDRLKDPEDVVDRRTGKRAIDNFEAFMRFLAPSPRGPITEEVRTGEQVFAAIGCTSCHVPALSTGAHASAALHRKPVPLFSDLLLHELGTGDGIEQGAAEPDEIRTPALWGLRLRRPLLHDGSAATTDEAIRRHAGEASGVIERYRSLTNEQRRALLTFLDSL